MKNEITHWITVTTGDVQAAFPAHYDGATCKGITESIIDAIEHAGFYIIDHPTGENCAAIVAQKASMVIKVWTDDAYQAMQREMKLAMARQQFAPGGNN